ncbi:M20 family metallo-hydrolase [Bosea sp. (in: a-proteobacteria)]|uniref:M20 family metallo-hydrolase n=1 Tax=Bosea sp. (in: a-proteobacteria) TaxID=1871050 RepID=UPI002636338C|nr:M20 family metallo-hydrolase [Bosea sp. (in: a-proteobacteria)]MCO5093156.1 M20 family metallo-hydrolase [Bosea sp. (in: a-proteobacteria)]
MRNMTIDGDRLWSTLMETAAFGGTPKGGIRRLSLTDEDKLVRDWFAKACRAAGCSVTIDRLGNMFARRPGQIDTLPPICIGSHLDTQPTGGKFDGVLGVLAGLEVLRTLEDAGYRTNAPIEVVNWTNEEGSRFAPAMLASGAYAGVFDVPSVLARKDAAGISIEAELERIGYAGDQPVGGRPISAMFELHIEQGPILDAEELDIGIVTGVQAMRWYELVLTGSDAHAGSTPMTMRRDALVAASDIVRLVRDVALAHAPLGLGTVGLIEARPGSRNVIPGEVFLTIDLRHPSDDVLERMEAELLDRARTLAAAAGIGLRSERIWKAPAIAFDPALNQHVRATVERLRLSHREIVSGAGHDAANIAKVAPTTMIFVPCRDGISHNEAEDTSPKACADGAAALLGAVLSFDATLQAGAPTA